MQCTHPPCRALGIYNHAMPPSHLPSLQAKPYNLLFPPLSPPSLSVCLPISFVSLVSAFKLAGSPSCVLFTLFPSSFASVPRTFLLCGRSSFPSSFLLPALPPLPMAFLSAPPADVPDLT